MIGNLQKQLQSELDAIKQEGLYKKERIIVNPQGSSIRVSTGENVLNFAPIIIWDYPLTQKLFKLQKILWILMDLECHLFVLFVEHKIFTKS